MLLRLKKSRSNSRMTVARDLALVNATYLSSGASKSRCMRTTTCLPLPVAGLPPHRFLSISSMVPSLAVVPDRGGIYASAQKLDPLATW